MSSPEKLQEVYDLCIRYLREAEELLNEGDSVQASEKLYKVVEECVKALAEHHSLPEHEESVKKGRWSAPRLDSAARRLALIYGDDVHNAWSIAYERLHMRGFHERELTPSQVKLELPRIEILLVILREELRKFSKQQL